MAKKSKTRPKPKGRCVSEALEALQKALALPEPDISINVQGGCYDEEQTRVFLMKVKDLTIEYQRTFGVKPSLSMWFD